MEKPILKNEIEAKITGTAAVEDNIKEAKEYALSLKEYYSTLVFTDEQLADAKNERAGINKVVKKISDYRKNIVSEFKKPIELFENTAKETEKILKETADYVDIQVKAFEQKEKDEKMKQVEDIYNKYVEELKDIVSLQKIFNDKWLNKTTSLDKVENEIIDIFTNIRNGLKSIDDLHSAFELELKNTFLQDFDLSKAIFKNTQLLEQKQALSKVEDVKEEIVQEKVETMLNEKVETKNDDPIKTYTLKITGTLSKQKALKQFLDLNNMKYEKVD